MRKLYFITIFIFQLLLLNCKDNPKPKFFIDQETKDYTVFQKGTYWVFENQFNEVDSQLIINSIRSEGDKHYHYDPESFQLNIKSSFYSDEIIYKTIIHSEDISNFAVWQLWAKSYLSFYYSYTSNDSLIVGNRKSISLEGKFETYNNGYKIFSNVKLFHSNSNILNSYQEVYWAKHVGRIEYLDSEGRRWKLKRFKVIQ